MATTSSTLTTDSPQSRRGAWARRTSPYLFVAPAALVLALLMGVPIVLVLIYSFIERAVVNPDFTFVGFDNYIKVMSTPRFWEALLHTGVFTAASVLGHLILG